jgi:DNA-binding Xre family transcriptional regulator
MARHFIKTTALAQKLNCSAQSLRKIKDRSDMPRLDGDRIAAICDALNELISKENSEKITPADLIEYHWK